MLKPIDVASDELNHWVRCDAPGVLLSTGYGPSVALELRSFNQEGHCQREALSDEQGRPIRVRSWDAKGALTHDQRYVAGVPHGIWGMQRGKSWTELTVEQGRVAFERDEAVRLGRLFTKTAVEWGDPQKLVQVVMREIGHYDLFGEALFALVRSGDLDPFASQSILMILSDWPGARAPEVDTILDDPRAFPSIPQLCLLAGWPGSVDRHDPWKRGAIAHADCPRRGASGCSSSSVALAWS